MTIAAQVWALKVAGSALRRKRHWSLCLWMAPGLRVLSSEGHLHWESLCPCILRCCYTTSPDPMGYRESHSWRVVAQDLAPWNNWPECLVPIPLKTSEDVNKVLTKCKTPTEAAWPPLCQAYQHAAAPVLHSQGSRDQSQWPCHHCTRGSWPRSSRVLPGHPGERSNHIRVSCQGHPLRIFLVTAHKVKPAGDNRELESETWNV